MASPERPIRLPSLHPRFPPESASTAAPIDPATMAAPPLASSVPALPGTYAPIAQPADLTDEQWRAVTHLAGDAAVAAGAGSGKTRVLVWRYVYLLTHPDDRVRVSPSELCCLTFTDAAAAQLRERAGRLLGQLGHERLRRQVLGLAQGESDGLAGPAAGSAYVATIHGFCMRLLREHALDTSFDPQARLIDDRERRRFYRDYWTRTLKTDTALFQLAARYDVTPVTQAVQAAIPLFQQYGHAADGLEHEYSDVDALLEQARAFGRDWVLAAQMKLVDWLEPVIAIEATGARTVEKRNELRLLHGSVRDHVGRGEPIEASVLTSIVEQMGRWYGLDAHDKSALHGARDRVRALLDSPWFALDTRGDAVFERDRAELLRVTCDAWRAFARFKSDRGLIDFDDLISGARALLRDRGGNIRRQFRHVLIDEFQDTDRLQAAVLRLLVPESATDPADAAAPAIFVVGDARQSIYRFRHADVSIMRELGARCEQHGARYPLAKNFRSDGAIIDFTNRVFTKLWKGEPDLAEPLEVGRSEPAGARVSPASEQQANQTEASELAQPERAGGTAAPSEPVIEALLFHPQQDDRDLHANKPTYESYPNRSFREAELIARRVRWLLDAGETVIDPDTGQARAVRSGDIAILVRKKRSIGAIERRLAAHGVAYQSTGSGNAFERDEVIDVCTLLAVIDNVEQPIAVASLLRSPYGRLLDDDLYWLRQALLVEADAIASVEQANAVDGAAALALSTRWKTRGLTPLLDPTMPLPRAPGSLPDTARDRFAAAIARITELRAMLARLRVAMPGRSAASMLALAMREVGAFEFAAVGEDGDRGVAALHHLLAFAREFEAEHAQPISALLDEVSRRAREQGDDMPPQAVSEWGAPSDVATDSWDERAGLPDAVQLRTIHAAKGLEFPVVIVAQLGQTVYIPPRLTDPERGVYGFSTLLPTVQAGFVGRPVDESGGLDPNLPRPLLQEWFRARDRIELLQEEQRLLYVACTRARDRLILSGHVEPDAWRARPDVRVPAGEKGSPAYAAWLAPALACSTLPEAPDLTARDDATAPTAGRHYVDVEIEAEAEAVPEADPAPDVARPDGETGTFARYRLWLDLPSPRAERVAQALADRAALDVDGDTAAIDAAYNKRVELDALARAAVVDRPLREAVDAALGRHLAVIERREDDVCATPAIAAASVDEVSAAMFCRVRQFQEYGLAAIDAEVESDNDIDVDASGHAPRGLDAVPALAARLRARMQLVRRVLSTVDLAALPQEPTREQAMSAVRAALGQAGGRADDALDNRPVAVDARIVRDGLVDFIGTNALARAAIENAHQERGTGRLRLLRGVTFTMGIGPTSVSGEISLALSRATPDGSRERVLVDLLPPMADLTPDRAGSSLFDAWLDRGMLVARAIHAAVDRLPNVLAQVELDTNATRETAITESACKIATDRARVALAQLASGTHGVTGDEPCDRCPWSLLSACDHAKWPHLAQS